ncbi:MAG: hypothetical protein K6A62_04540 [Bacteroidales bacterium]|nr:hypothetical protein [Bacteroidales bacterium]
MKAKLVHSNARQRWYELSVPIHKGISDILGEVDIVKDVKSFIERRIKPEYRSAVLEAYKDGCRTVVVSDAHTHIERLVFPGFCINGIWGILSGEIDGKHTFMSDGGDPNSVYNDEVYLRHLCSLNKISWEGFEK